MWKRPAGLPCDRSPSDHPGPRSPWAHPCEINPTPEQLAEAGGVVTILALGCGDSQRRCGAATQIMHGWLVVTTDRRASWWPSPIPARCYAAAYVHRPTCCSGRSHREPPGSCMIPSMRTTWLSATARWSGHGSQAADPNYVLLPGTLLWRVRTSTVLTPPRPTERLQRAASRLTRVSTLRMRTLTGATSTWANSDPAVLRGAAQPGLSSSERLPLQ